ncbi:MAG: hypothetical protein J7556_18610 [Acidovorax sp.]|nr:hypothetical protein [Acidovorax sp.]
MHSTCSQLLATSILAFAGTAQAALVSTATLNRGDGKIIFELFSERAEIPECVGRNDLAVIARYEKSGKIRPYGTGCWVAGADGVITLKVKSFDDGVVRSSRLHNSELKDVASASPATGDSRTSSATFGPWTFSKGVTSQGTQVCALSTADKVSAGARNVSIKALANRDHLTITLYDAKWSYKPESKHQLALDFDDQKPLQIRAYGDVNMLDADFPKEGTVVFLSQLKDREVFRITLPDGGVWAMRLSGIRGQLTQFLECGRSGGKP